jgi:hypothetical protein
MTIKWTESQLMVVCSVYKKYKNDFKDKNLAYIIKDNLKRLSLHFINKSNNYPTVNSICSIIYKIRLFEKNKPGISKQHYKIWNNVKTGIYYNIPIYAGMFKLSNNMDILVKVLGSAYINGEALDIYNQKLFEINFEMLPYILDIDDLQYHNTKSQKKIEFVDLYNEDKSVKVVEIYTFNVLLEKNNDRNTYIITNLRKKYKYDCLKTYCIYYMDSIIQAASLTCANKHENDQDEFVEYFNDIKERIENDNKMVDDNEILDLIDIIRPNNILQYYI